MGEETELGAGVDANKPSNSCPISRGDEVGYGELGLVSSELKDILKLGAGFVHVLCSPFLYGRVIIFC